MLVENTGVMDPAKASTKILKHAKKAAANSLVIGKVQLGQSPEKVREIMGADPEHREASDGIETWGYRTNYDDRLFTRIIFENGRVITINQYTR